MRCRSFCDFKWCFEWGCACVKQAGANPDVLRKRSKAPSALDKEDKTYQTDVVIVGGGGAGLAAAAAVLQAGKNQLLLRNSQQLEEILFMQVVQ